MSNRPHGKHVSISQSNPQALGICDYTGFVFPKKDLIKQMEWRGNSLVWTGFLVGRPYVDKPNQQLRPPILPPDPIPVKNPRLQQPSAAVWSNQSMAWTDLAVETWDSWSGSDDGIPVGTPAERLSALQQEIPVQETPYAVAGEQTDSTLTEVQKLNALQNFYWDPNV
jgi:hypothetical protein